MSNVTPMMKQYLSIKEEHKDAFLFFRLGDFYELFYDDAVEAAKLLEITLTSRDKTSNIPMAGVPYHSATRYIEKLINHGYKVAICEQMEDPKAVKGMVKREVVRVITPGTLIDDFGISQDESNYILSLNHRDDIYDVVYGDISTGDMYSFETKDLDTLYTQLSRINPREIVVSNNSEAVLHNFYNDPPLITVVDGTSSEVQLLSYIESQNKQRLSHLKDIIEINVDSNLKLSQSTISNLELVENLQTKKQKGSLYWYLNKTETPMGRRKLKRLIESPLVNLEEIKNRQDVVGKLLENFIEREDIKAALNNVYDIERLTGRMSFGNIDVKGFIELRDSLEGLPNVYKLLSSIGLIDNVLFKDFDVLSDVYEMLKVLKSDAPKTIREGNIFEYGVSKELDELRDIQNNSREWLENYLSKEKEKTNIKNMKIGFNKVFGYFLEISKGQAATFDAEKFGYDRRQTLTNSERYITPELKEMEDKILKAEDESVILEYNMFIDLREKVKGHTERLQRTSEQLSILDCLISFADVSNEYQLVKPEFTEDELEIIDGRHPIVEKMLGERTYVPNDVKMDDDTFIYLITGPNMSGKSTYMRQVAIITIMSQIGMNVPATSCKIPIFDAIYTRIGASDDLSSGKSTFMIEMMEANDALKHATKNSLIIFDELGRGTSTYDGMALAEAMLKYIHNYIGAKTLFSTHYHELTDLDASLHHLMNVHVKASEKNGVLEFQHKVEKGAVEKSYGIQVAELADLPREVTIEARKVLKRLENTNDNTVDVTQLELTLDDASEQTSAIEEKIKTLNINHISPIEALTLLSEFQDELK
ncbi:DNA mismatch repair protein MutS [Nosocomiicoccus ampullae]|uniref:DNA mismatch repair protein MutS n=1 Tax=Nosocomiicoccus ampullae TaxID=489910 RepID=UPI001C5D86E2|nr:DNA mismatch repair protein MutS [Nosocomiicoccus ampullae]QYA49080.1 DNA mismatch repair protein MutS [Nosocomiicoccus ampullae]